MSESVKLPVWVIVLIVGLLAPLLAGAVYVVETRALATAAETRAEDIDKRLKRIETGVDQIWTHVLNSKDGQ